MTECDADCDLSVLKCKPFLGTFTIVRDPDWFRLDICV